MAENNSVERAEQRVREMNSVTRRYAEQGSRYMNSMNAATRFETVDVRPEEVFPSKPSGTPQRDQREAGKTRQREDARKSVRSIVKNAAAGDGEKSHKEQLRPVQNDVPRGDGGYDGEKLLLLAVIYLLMRENADIKLILALCYLIL